MTKLLLTIGIPASGKSVLAEQMKDFVCVERDFFRKKQYDQGQSWSQEFEKNVAKEQEIEVLMHLKNNRNVIISDTNINPKTREKWKAIAKNLNVDYSEIIIRCDLDLALERNKTRTGWKFVPENKIKEFYIRFTEQFPLHYKPMKCLPKAFIFDVDGTLAKNNSGRSFYEWNNVIMDDVYWDIANLCNDLYLLDYQILILSGRDSICKADTHTWLEKNTISYDKLIMRPKGNKLPDHIIKHDLFHKHIAPYYTVLGVFDDRPKVCDMWRSIQLRIYQIGDPAVKTKPTNY